MTPPTLFATHRASAILRTNIASAAEPAMRAAVEAGFRIIEFTLTTPGAFDLVKRFADEFPDVTVGAGSVLTIEDARKAVDHGARFLVSPVTDVDVITAADAFGVPMIAGTYTPTDMLTAHRAGAPYQKLFPLPTNPEAFIRACLGPMPFLRIVPTGGVTTDNAAAVLRAGAHAVGFVAPIFDPTDMEAGDWAAIRARAERCLQAVEGA